MHVARIDESRDNTSGHLVFDLSAWPSAVGAAGLLASARLDVKPRELTHVRTLSRLALDAIFLRCAACKSPAPSNSCGYACNFNIANLRSASIVPLLTRRWALRGAAGR